MSVEPINTKNLKANIKSIYRAPASDGRRASVIVRFSGCNLNCAWCREEEVIMPGKKNLEETLSISKVIDSIMDLYNPGDDVVFAGGEPLVQSEFLNSILSILLDKNIFTVLESNLCVAIEVTRPIFEKIKLLVADVKCNTGVLHKYWTRHDNELAKSNIKMAADMGIPMIIRTPVIAGVNSTVAEMQDIARFAIGINTLEYLELVKFIPMDSDSMKELGIKRPEFSIPADNLMAQMADAISSVGVKVLMSEYPNR